MPRSNEAKLILSLEARTKRMERALDKARGKLNSSTRSMSRTWDKRLTTMQRRAKSFGKSVAGAFALFTGAGGLGFAAATKGALQHTEQLRNLSLIAGITAEEFQKASFAADKFGVSQEKLADIFKDVNDKLGDFVVTGQGPLVDFFEQIGPKVGVTIDSFKGLTSSQALELYISSLQKANASQRDFTFFMEAIASDATALLPLLKDNAAGFRGYGKEAEKLGLVLSNDVVAQGAAANQKLEDLGKTIQGNVTRALVDLAPEIETLSQQLIDLVPHFVSWLSDVVKWADEAGTAFGELAGRAHRFNLARMSGNVSLAFADEFKTETELLLKTAKLNEQIGKATGRVVEQLKKQKSGERLNRGEKQILKSAQKRREELMDELEVVQKILDERRKTAEIEGGGAGGSGSGGTGGRDGTGGSGGGDASSSGLSRLTSQQKEAIAAQKKANAETLAEIKDGLSKAKALYESALTPIEKYQARLAELNAVERDSLLFSAAGGQETFARQKAEAVLELADATDSYRVAMAEVQKLSQRGDLTSQQFKDLTDQLRALKKEMDLEKDNEKLEENIQLREEKFAQLLKEREAKAALAAAAGRTDEEERLRREIELLIRKNDLMREGLDETSAKQQAEREVEELDTAIAEGKVRDAIKSAARAGFTDGFDGIKDHIKDGLRDAANNMFDRALDSLLDGLLSGFQQNLGGLLGGGAGGGGLLGSLGTVFAGFFDQGGRIGANRLAVVGERGPELISSGSKPIRVMGRRATQDALNTRAGGGMMGSTITQTFQINGTDTEMTLKKAFNYADRKSREAYGKAMKDTDRRSVKRQAGFAS